MTMGADSNLPAREGVMSTAAMTRTGAGEEIRLVPGEAVAEGWQEEFDGRGVQRVCEHHTLGGPVPDDAEDAPAFVLLLEGSVIGVASLLPVSAGEMSLAITIAAGYRRRSEVTDLVRAAARHAASLGFDRLVTSVALGVDGPMSIFARAGLATVSVISYGGTAQVVLEAADRVN
jgi:hypothetical protein